MKKVGTMMKVVVLKRLLKILAKITLLCYSAGALFFSIWTYLFESYIPYRFINKHLRGQGRAKWRI